MKKIYLAISEQAERMDSLQSQLNNIKDSEIIPLSSVEQIEQVLFHQPFYMMFVSAAYMTVEKLAKENIQGTLFIYDEKETFVPNEEKNILVCKNFNELIHRTILKHFENKDIVNREKQLSNNKEKEPTRVIESIKEDKQLEPFRPIEQVTDEKVEEDKEDNEISSTAATPSDEPLILKPKEEAENELTIPIKPKSEQIETNEVAPKIEKIEKEKVVDTPPKVKNQKVVDKEKVSPATEPQDDYSWDYIWERTNEFRTKQLEVKPEKNLRIGVWSPLQRIGVTSFILNFAIYLMKHKLKIAVVENLNNRPRLKSLLSRYQSQPKDWSSYADIFFNKDIPTERTNWLYKDVAWFPLGDNDSKQKWNEKLLLFNFGNLIHYNLLFVDLPTGPMEKYTKDTLHYLDELWIMVDDSPDQLKEWKNKIHQEILTKNIKTKIIFNRSCSKSKPDGISNILEIPLLAELPTLHTEYVTGQYSNKPLIESIKAYQKLLPAYIQLEEHLLITKKREDQLFLNVKNKVNDYYRWLKLINSK